MNEKRSTPSPPIKSNTWCIQLYKESDDYNTDTLLAKIRDFAEWYYILHDRDIDADTGELKKPHYHIVCSTGANTTDSAISKRLDGLSVQWIRKTKNKVGAKRYLIHADDPDKFQYSVSDVLSSVPYIISRDESSQVKMLLDWLDSINRPVTMLEVLRWSVENTCYSGLRRGANLFRDVVKEHNIEVLKNG